MHLDHVGTMRVHALPMIDRQEFSLASLVGGETFVVALWLLRSHAERKWQRAQDADDAADDAAGARQPRAIVAAVLCQGQKAQQAWHAASDWAS